MLFATCGGGSARGQREQMTPGRRTARGLRQGRAAILFVFLQRGGNSNFRGLFENPISNLQREMTSWNKTPPRRPKVPPRRAKMLPKRSQNPYRCPRTPPRRPKTLPRRSKLVPGCLRRRKMIPNASKKAPQKPKTPPRTAPKTPLGILNSDLRGAAVLPALRAQSAAPPASPR